MITSSKLVGLMAEPDRRRVVAALILSAGDLDYVVETSRLEHREASTALNRLSAAGLVELSAAGVYVLLEEAFKMAARADRETGDRTAAPALDTGQERVVRQSIVDGRLLNLPRKRSKRLLVLDHLAQCFEPGVHYTERQVNSLLRPFDDDVARLRRYLVDEAFLDRADGTYWRSGGTISPAG